MAHPTYAELIADRIHLMPQHWLVGARVAEVFPVEDTAAWRYRWRSDEMPPAADQVVAFAGIRQAVMAARREEATRTGRESESVVVYVMAQIPDSWFVIHP